MSSFNSRLFVNIICVHQTNPSHLNFSTLDLVGELLTSYVVAHIQRCPAGEKIRIIYIACITGLTEDIVGIPLNNYCFKPLIILLIKDIQKTAPQIVRKNPTMQMIPPIVLAFSPVFFITVFFFFLERIVNTNSCFNMMSRPQKNNPSPKKNDKACILYSAISSIMKIAINVMIIPILRNHTSKLLHFCSETFSHILIFLKECLKRLTFRSIYHTYRLINAGAVNRITH